jgi:hypothetical protein
MEGGNATIRRQDKPPTPDKRARAGRSHGFAASRGYARALLAAEDRDVLHCGDEPVLDLLAPKAPPACALEVVAIGGLREAAFHQVPATSLGGEGLRRVRLLLRGKQLLLFPVTRDRAAKLFAPGALLSKRAGRAGAN